MGLGVFLFGLKGDPAKNGIFWDDVLKDYRLISKSKRPGGAICRFIFVILQNPKTGVQLKSLLTPEWNSQEQALTLIEKVKDSRIVKKSATRLLFC